MKIKKLAGLEQFESLLRRLVVVQKQETDKLESANKKRRKAKRVKKK